MKRGDRCTFEAILEDFNLTDPALHRMGQIVRAADVKGQEHITPEGGGLRVIAEGFASLGISDEEHYGFSFRCMTRCTPMRATVRNEGGRGSDVTRR